jgi:hypothetical protein
LFAAAIVELENCRVIELNAVEGQARIFGLAMILRGETCLYLSHSEWSQGRDPPRLNDPLSEEQPSVAAMGAAT